MENTAMSVIIQSLALPPPLVPPLSSRLEGVRLRHAKRLDQLESSVKIIYYFSSTELIRSLNFLLAIRQPHPAPQRQAAQLYSPLANKLPFAIMSTPHPAFKLVNDPDRLYRSRAPCLSAVTASCYNQRKRKKNIHPSLPATRPYPGGVPALPLPFAPCRGEYYLFLVGTGMA